MSERKKRLGYIGIGIGSISLLMALFHFYAGPFSPHPTIETTIAEKAVKIRDATVAALKGKELEKESWVSKWDTDKIIDVVTALLGGIAIIIGIIAYVQKETIRVAGGAAILGVGAIAFQFVALALGAIVVAIILAAVLSQLDFL